jgi:hypothetical protein
MKKIFTYLAIAIIGLASLASCSKKSDSTPAYSMKATIGTTAVSETSCIAIVNGSALSVTGFTGSSTTPPYFNLTIQNFSGAGTYTLDSTAIVPVVTCIYYPDAIVTNTKVAKSGTITVTSSSSTSVSGTFSFLCSDGTSISGGSFTAKK